ncbi:hypothetical protein [Amycolatopsis taiwanensis]|uniref:hypothetical protein n=1 Tax=Amycolatopsis taiwanensis TaxID=342230 RepID=UPI0004850203|nr:hypothetical protein [Amycolatopsis taiwanensis]
MAATAITPATISRSGTAYQTLAACDATNGNTVPNSGQVFLELSNTDTASHTVTVAIPGVVDGVASPGKVISLSASAHGLYGPFPLAIYGPNLAFTADSNLVKVAAYQLPLS